MTHETNRETVEHPPWCDRETCTAPELRPTTEEYRSVGVLEMGEHRSAPISTRAGGIAGDMVMSLTQRVCPWDTEVFLELHMPSGQLLGSVAMDTTGGGFELYELLGQEVEEKVRKYPALYSERFLRRHAIDEDERAAKGCTHPPEEPCFGRKSDRGVGAGE